MADTETRSTNTEPVDLAAVGKKKTQSIKCLVWDLDDTLWDGILLEDREVRVRPEAVALLKALDERGILHSIASRNDREMALTQLRALGLDDYFLYPQIHWNSKSSSVAQIALDLNLGLDALAFLDDQPFEREEVAFTHGEVLCLDSRQRRRMYQADLERNQVEAEYEGPKEEFLATLGMVFTIAPCRESDLQRAEELTVRTNQLNATGYTYSYEELDALRGSAGHHLLMASLEDRHGSYGKIGLALVERGAEAWTVKLLLMSCRVMSKAVGTLLLNHILRQAKEAGVDLHAEFVPTERNRQMLIAYKFAGFKELKRSLDQPEVVTFRHDLQQIQASPDYVDLRVETA